MGILLEPSVDESSTSKIKSLAWKGLAWTVTTFLAPKYDSSPLHAKIYEYLKEMRLKDTLTNIVIPTYDIQNRQPCVFSTQQTLLAIREATKTFKNQDISRYSPPDSSNYLVLSLGTGNSDVIQVLPIKDGGLADWFDLPNKSSPLVDVLFQAAEDMVDIYTSTILGDHNSPHNFLRIQDCTMKACEASMDDGSKENLARLEKIGNDLLERSVSIANPETGLQEMMPNTLTRGGAPSNQVATTNRQALISFARKLSEERRRRLGYPA
ncbi:hypothetical protein L1049_003758 [Liquidambar formosana]|uniref:Uncharacterized protein n=1 Tax=Liquidambar formosana TaxID=63359 RepID=A0AAP0WVE3_LIQFO